MKPARCLFSLLLHIFLVYTAGAQGPVQKMAAGNLRFKTLAVKGDIIRIDTLSIVPGTFLPQDIVPESYYLDAPKAVLHWKIKPTKDSIRVSYRVFPFLMSQVAQRLDYDSLAAATIIRPAEMTVGKEGRSIFNFGNLQYSGSFGRGIAFGNNQDAVVQSNFNLQLNGILADSIEIAAAITDNNLPIQPDGTTQQLNEFDQVFLQFRKKDWQLNLGDIDLRQNDLYFLSFYKRLQGVTFQTMADTSKKVKTATLVSGSIAKGKFNRNVFQGLEGNQGPYRLSGANNEFFFIVLANTERVFIDGQLMQRGEDADYIINYNTAEVVFMPRRMITKDSRIQVEFEYADRNYLNANLYAHQSVQLGEKLQLRLGIFTNADARNSPINQQLNGSQKQFLYNIGDSINRALYPVAYPDTTGKEKVLYEKVLVSNGAVLDSFYRFSTDTAVTRYVLSFTDLGQGKGDYLPDFNGANGKVFRYVTPINGTKQGRYAPVQLLATPKKQQLVSLAADYSPNENNKVATELAVSNYDPNTLSLLQNGDDKALAAKLAYTNSARLKGRDAAVISSFYLEHVQAKFKPLERFRNVEFSREWGLLPISRPADETIAKAGTELKNNTFGDLNYQFTFYQRSDDYKGIQHLVQQGGKFAGWQLNNSLMHTQFENGRAKGKYLRPVIEVQKELSKWRNILFALRYTMEKNEVHEDKDSLSNLSFAFHTYAASLQTNSKGQNQYGLTFFTRTDQLPQGDKLQKADRSFNLNFKAELLQSTRHQLVLNTTFRHLAVIRTDLSKEQPDQTLLGRAEYQINEWNGLLTGNVLYEIGAGQEQRRDFTYIEVPAGQGEYAWFDYNKDGIQQISEFELAQFRDQARFLRILIPTNDYVKAAYTTLNYNFTLNPKTLWKRAHLNGWRQLLTRFTVQTSLQTAKKTVADETVRFNPFLQHLLDTALISTNTSMGHTFSFNRFSSAWGIDLASFQSSVKALMTYGFESRETAEWNLKGRWMLSRAINLDIALRKGNNGLFTPKFENRNYNVKYQVLEPRLTYINGTVFRIQGSYKYEEKENAGAYGGQMALSHAIKLETKYNVLQNSSLSSHFVYQAISFSDKANTPIAYTMLEGLLPGKNFLWNLELTKRLINNIELSFQYDGRQPARAKTVHTGRASLRALF